MLTNFSWKQRASSTKNKFCKSLQPSKGMVTLDESAAFRILEFQKAFLQRVHGPLHRRIPLFVLAKRLDRQHHDLILHPLTVAFAALAFVAFKQRNHVGQRFERNGPLALGVRCLQQNSQKRTNLMAVERNRIQKQLFNSALQGRKTNAIKKQPFSNSHFFAYFISTFEGNFLNDRCGIRFFRGLLQSNRNVFQQRKNRMQRHRIFLMIL